MGRLVALYASTGKNADLAKSCAEIAQNVGHEAQLIDICGLDFPLYTPEVEEATEHIDGLAELMDTLSASDGWIVCAPEYNGSMPPVLNNMIAWLSREGDDFRRLFRFRRVALATVSGGGGQTCITAMRLQFAHLGCTVLGRTLVVNKHRPKNSASITEIIEELMS